jgi:hypothetical protein
MFPPFHAWIEFCAQTILPNLTRIELPPMVLMLHQCDTFFRADGDVESQMVASWFVLTKRGVRHPANQKRIFLQHHFRNATVLITRQRQFRHNDAVNMADYIGGSAEQVSDVR